MTPSRTDPRYMFARAIMLAGLCLLFALPSADAKSECDQDWLCIDEVRNGDTVELRARNLNDYPLTYTLQVRSRTMQIQGADTVTRTLPPRQSETAIVLNNDDARSNARYSIRFDWTIGYMDPNHDDEHVYAFPYEKGLTYRIMQGYGSRFSHTGREEFSIDFDMPVGTPVHAARAGVVARVVESNDKGCWEDGCGAYANFIVVLHSDGTTGEYYHLQKDGALVEVGDQVERGQRIGYSGNTGHTALPHLHFAVYRATTWGNTQSIPVRFQSADGIVNSPRRGGRHQAAY